MGQPFYATAIVTAAVILGVSAWAQAQVGVTGGTTDSVILRANSEEVPPVDPQSVDQVRFFVDTIVGEVVVDATMTVAQMAELPESPCRSQAYVFGRDEPKWLYQTGRLLQAMRERAPIRISFSCVDGVQSINALQFLEPPAETVVYDFPRQSDTIVLTENTPSLRAGAVLSEADLAAPVGSIGGTREERVRQIPLP
ncbi:MAG: hypothetical protein AAF580_06000 [Pseudomonadota bacterium]